MFYPLLVTVLTVGGAALRLAYLFQPMRYDESFTMLAFSSQPLSTGLSSYPFPNNHLFHTLLVHLTSALFGNSPAVLRLPAFLAGVALIPVGYLVLKELYDRDTGALAAALIAASPLLIAYSVNARGYTIQALAFLLLVLVARRLKEGQKLSYWLAFGLLTVVGFYTIPTMLYFFGAVFVWLAISAIVRDVKGPRRGFLLRLVGWSALSLGVSALLYVPVIVKSGLSSLTSNQFVKALALGKFFSGLGGEARNLWLAWSAGLTQVFAILFAIAIIISLVFHYRMSKDRVPLSAVALVWCLALVAVQRVLPEPRVFLPLLPLFLGFAAAGFTFTGRMAAREARARTGKKLAFNKVAKAALVFVAFAVLALVVVVQATPYQRDDTGKKGPSTFAAAEKIATRLAHTLKPGDAVYVDWRARPQLEYYFTRLGIDHHYIYGNSFGTPQTGSSVTRAFIIGDPAEGHSLEIAANSPGKNLKIDPSQLVLKKFYAADGATIYLVTGPRQ